MKPPKRKADMKAPDPERTSGKRPGERDAPASAERTSPEGGARPEDVREATPRDNEQITNQDEQEKITNTRGEDTPEK